MVPLRGDVYASSMLEIVEDWDNVATGDEGVEMKSIWRSDNEGGSVTSTFNTLAHTFLRIMLVIDDSISES
jgi:hypothetical protein